MEQPDARPRRALRTAALALACGGAALLVWLPWLPRAPDLYVHLIWAWEVARCAAQGQPPLWLPDLNAGFGSPGIRLYSPLGPVLSGGLGLLLGDAGRGLRAAALLAAAAVVAVGRRPGESSERGGAGWVGAVALASPMVLFSLVGRAAWSEFLAVPLLWWLIERLLDGRLRAGRDGAAIAALWLLHVPSALMAGCLGAASLLLHRSRDHAARLLGAAAVGAGLSAWHWLPLLDESSRTGGGEVLTSGIFEPARNLLGSPTAHALHHNIWLGWVAAVLLLAMLVTGAWRAHPARVALAAGCIFLASPLAAFVWRLATPLQLLQFPWRWLLPATLLLIPVVLGRRTAQVAGLLCLLAPSLLMGWTQWAAVPRLDAAMTWREAGAALYESLGANPRLVDAAQNRPAAFAELGRNLQVFGMDLRAVTSDGGRVTAVRRWSPLEREVEVAGGEPFVVGFRILDYPFWSLEIDGGADFEPGGVRGVVSCRLPPGRHLVRATWEGNPLSEVGQIVAALTVLGLFLRWRRTGGASP